MSAWVVEREHIDVMIRKALERQHGAMLQWVGENGYRQIDHENASEIGLILAQENVASVCCRYEQDTAEQYEDMLEYAYRDPGYVLTPAEVFKTVGCYEYQSCEHPGWETSEAKRFCEALREAAQAELYSGPWGWDKDELAKRKEFATTLGT